METLGQRIKFAGEKIGGLEVLANATGIKRATMFNYASGSTEPKVSAIIEISKATGASVDWLMTGNGSMLVGGDVRFANATLADVRKYVWNIAATYWETLPKRTKPEQVADQFVETLDFLLSRQEVTDDAASEVIQFGAERLKRKPNSSS